MLEKAKWAGLVYLLITHIADSYIHHIHSISIIYPVIIAGGVYEDTDAFSPLSLWLGIAFIHQLAVLYHYGIFVTLHCASRIFRRRHLYQ